MTLREVIMASIVVLGVALRAGAVLQVTFFLKCAICLGT